MKLELAKVCRAIFWLIFGCLFILFFLSQKYSWEDYGLAGAFYSK